MKVMTIELAIAKFLDAAECRPDMQARCEFAWYADRLEELKAYRSTGYTPEQITELHDKHWNECRQIALYDDKIKQMQEHIDRLKGIIDGLCGYVGCSASGWIPCSERMPQTGTRVYVREGDFTAIGFFGKFTQRWIEPISGAHLDNVTHWMPLPEPPEDVE